MSGSFHLFERFGVELEYMIVDGRTLDVMPVADAVLRAVCGTYESEVEVGELSWSNELVLHVIELKTNGPCRQLGGLSEWFLHDVRRINELLGPLSGRLMPTAMHPWMDPQRETVLWPHEYSPIYEAFDRIFGCHGHGWSNLQASHINLPFADDEEFGRLHAAVRLVLPIIPAVAASSPFLEGRDGGLADARLEAYRGNAVRIPRVTGRVIPEPAYTRADYEAMVLRPLYADIAPHDPQRILQHEWLNARGAIARFDRNTMEIRLLDMQECPAADVAILRLLVAVLRALVEERWCSYARQRAWETEPLAAILSEAIRRGDEAEIADPDYLRCFGLWDAHHAGAGQVWRRLYDELVPKAERGTSEWRAMEVILDEGCLSRRIRRSAGPNPDRPQLARVYGELCACLADGRSFHG